MADETRRDDASPDPVPPGRLDPTLIDRGVQRETEVDRPGRGSDGLGGGGGGDGGGDNGGDDPWLRLPEELARDWIVLRRLTRGGGESSLYLVRARDPAAAGEQRVIKIYNAGAFPNIDILNRIARLDPAHVVRLYDHREVQGRYVEILEFIPGGSLDALCQIGEPVDPSRVRALVTGLAAALEHIHEADIVHRDIKPANILLRTLDPLDIVLTDFGIASRLEGSSRRETTGSKTPSYASPESSWHEVSHGSDWWSMGILLVEMLTGRHPFLQEDGPDLMSTGQIARRLAIGDVEELVEGVPEDWLLLCRGLLRRELDNRWGADEVRRWLRGDPTLTVVPEAAPGNPAFRFAGSDRDHYVLKDVARILSEHWAEAAVSYRRGDVQDWLKKVCDERMLSSVKAIDRAYSRNTITVDDALFQTIVTIDPAIIPSYRGYPLSGSGLARLAEEALDNREPAPAVLQELLEFGCLSTYSTLRGPTWCREREEAWHRQLDTYVALSSLVPEEHRPILEAQLPSAVAVGLRASLPDSAGWSAALRARAAADRPPSRDIPDWYADLQRVTENSSEAALIGLGVLRAVADGEAKETADRRQQNRAERVRQMLTASRVVGIMLVMGLVVLGILALFGR